MQWNRGLHQLEPMQHPVSRTGRSLHQRERAHARMEDKQARELRQNEVLDLHDNFKVRNASCFQQPRFEDRCNTHKCRACGVPNVVRERKDSAGERVVTYSVVQRTNSPGREAPYPRCAGRPATNARTHRTGGLFALLQVSNTALYLLWCLD